MNEIRILYPNLYLERIPGVRTLASPVNMDLDAGLPGEEKIALIQRFYLQVDSVRKLLRNGYLIVYELDDYPFREPDKFGDNNFYLRGNHAIQTSTREIADAVRKLCPELAIFPNQLVSLPAPREKSSLEEITIFFGALNRELEHPQLMPVLNKLCQEYAGRLNFLVVHDRTFFDGLETSQKKFYPVCDYGAYTKLLRQADIALLPLTDNIFNRCKSDLKFLECAGHGVAVLASPTVYEKSIVDGNTGFLYRDNSEFETKLRALLDNPILRFQICDQAYQYVARERLLAYHYQKRYRWYCDLLDRNQDLQKGLEKRAPEIS